MLANEKHKFMLNCHLMMTLEKSGVEWGKHEKKQMKSWGVQVEDPKTGRKRAKKESRISKLKIQTNGRIIIYIYFF